LPSPEKSEHSAGLSFSSQRQTLILGLLLVVATLALYNPVSHHPFVNYDDDRYVGDNIHVKAGLHWDTIPWAFTTYDEANWHPLTWLSHALDCQLFGLNPAGHHYTNVLLHAFNVLLLFVFLKRATSSVWRSLMAAALFALHFVAGWFASAWGVFALPRPAVSVEATANPYQVIGSGLAQDVLVPGRLALQRDVERWMHLFGSAGKAA